MYKIAATHPTPYEIIIGENCTKTSKFKEFIKKCAPRIILVTDENVAKLYSEEILSHLSGLSVIQYTIPSGEIAKSRKTTNALEDFMQSNNIAKDSIIIALGGGVVTDLTGFVGATYMRGIKTLYIPTTMLAMVDASIGGKTGINTKYGKNQLGTITSPFSVYIDPCFLVSQSNNVWQDGWVETLKHSLLDNKETFDATCIASKKNIVNDNLTKLLYHSCCIKNDIVTKDPYEKGIRASLNIGHTIGHGIEAYHNFNISHGQAVAIGIIAECKISYELGIMKTTCFEKIKQGFKDFAAKTQPIANKDMFISYLMKDKKNSNGKINMCLLQKIGIVHSNDSFLTSIDLKHIFMAIEFINNEFT